jgi:hypothetical protein
MKTFHKVVHQVDICHFSLFLIAFLLTILCHIAIYKNACFFTLKGWSRGLFCLHLFLRMLLKGLPFLRLVWRILVSMVYSLIRNLLLFIVLLSSSSFSPESLLALFSFRIVYYHCCLCFCLLLIIIITIICFKIYAETFSLSWNSLLFD